jgi:hypothetical protein
MKRSAVALLLLVALLATGCGGGGSTAQQTSSGETTATVSGSETSLIAAAGEKTRAAGTARVSFTVTIEGPQGSGTMSGEGVTGRGRAHMTVDFGGFAGALGKGKAEMIFDDLVFYVKLPPASSAQLPAGKTWLKIDLTKLSNQGQLDVADLLQLNQTDPSQTLDLLRGAGEFDEVGSDEVRGEETTHYRGTVDLTKAIENAPADARDQVRKLFEQTGTTTVPMDIWVDDRGLVRQLEFTQKAQGMSITVHQELYDFGAELDTTPPPADEVLDITDLLANS